jgi:hypothetical protein
MSMVRRASASLLHGRTALAALLKWQAGRNDVRRF